MSSEEISDAYNENRFDVEKMSIEELQKLKEKMKTSRMKDNRKTGFGKSTGMEHYLEAYIKLRQDKEKS